MRRHLHSTGKSAIVISIYSKLVLNEKIGASISGIVSGERRQTHAGQASVWKYAGEVRRICYGGLGICRDQ